MSLILEALKKSEAERRLGQAPGLLSPTLSAPPRRRRHAPLVAAGALVAVALAAAGGWWLAQRGGPGTDSAAPVAGSVPPASGAAVDAVPAGGALPLPPAAGGSQTQPAAKAPAPDPVPLATTPPPVASVAPQPSPATRPAEPAAPVPALPSDPTFASIEREARALVAGEAPPLDQPVAPSTSTDAPTAPPAPARLQVPAPVAEAAGAGNGGQPSLEQLPGLRQLPDDVRAALPPLKLSMHVFAEAPDERFVLIDGRRYGEGAALGDGLLVEEIRRDGVVMVRDGTRFLLRRPG